MSSRSEYIISVLTVCFLILASLASGCSSEEESCTVVIGEINSIEKSSDGRLKTMDFSVSDEIFHSQLRASKDQYRDALEKLYSLGPSPCLCGFAYETRIKSLQLKYDFLMIFSKMSENDRRAEEIFYTSTPKFREGLIEVINEYENIRERILFLSVMAGDIDKTLLDPEFVDMIPFVSGQLDVMLSSVDSKTSYLMGYR